MALDVYKDWLGIPEGPRPPDHYTLLRLQKFEDDFQRIESNYKKLNAHVRKYATGQYMLQSQELLNELAKAKLCLTDPEWKRDYDESLGREFPEELDRFGRRQMENVLREVAGLSREQVREVQDFAEARGLSLRDAVVQMKLTDPETAARALAMALGRPYLDLNDVFPDDSVLDKLPRSVVKRYTILPLFVDEDRVLVACIDEPEPELEDEIRLRYGLPMRAVLATPLAVNQAIARYYAPGARDEAAAEAAAPARKSQKTSAAPARKRAGLAKVTPAEKAERKNLAIIIMCWGVIGPYVIDNFVLKPWLFPAWSFFVPPPIATILIAPAVVWFAWKNYWN